MKKTAITLIIIFSMGFCLFGIQPIEKSLMYHPSKEIKPMIEQLQVKSKKETFLNSENLKLEYLHINPNSNKKPVIVYCHGNSNNSTFYQEKLVFLANSGYQVFVLDYRGYGNSEGSPSEQGLYKDVSDFISYIGKQYNLKKQDMLIWGHSLGGAIVAEVVSKDNNYKAVILESTFTSMMDMKNFRRDIQTNPIKKAFYELIPLTQQFDSYKKVKNIKLPTLIMCSEKDEVIPCKMGSRLKENISNSQFYKVNDALLDDYGWQEEKVLDFINEIK